MKKLTIIILCLLLLTSGTSEPQMGQYLVRYSLSPSGYNRTAVVDIPVGRTAEATYIFIREAVAKKYRITWASVDINECYKLN